MYVRNCPLHVTRALVPSTVDLDRKLSLRRDRDELIKQGIIQPTEGEMLEGTYVRTYMYVWYVKALFFYVASTTDGLIAQYMYVCTCVV